MKLPIRQVLIFSFAFEIFIAVGIISFLSNKFSQIAINNIAEQWRGEVGNRIQNHVTAFSTSIWDKMGTVSKVG